MRFVPVVADADVDDQLHVQLPDVLHQLAHALGGVGAQQRFVQRLNAEVTKIVARTDVQAEWAKQGAVPMTMTSAAFDRYLAKGQPGYVEKERLYPEQAIRLAVDANAVPVLAHPLSLGLDPAELDFPFHFPIYASGTAVGNMEEKKFSFQHIIWEPTFGIGIRF